MKVGQIIQDAYRFANIVAEVGEDLTAGQLQTGLRLLNYVLDEINIQGKEIIATAKETKDLTAGSTSLMLDDYIDIFTAHYAIGNTKVQMRLLSLEEFSAEDVVDTKSVPFSAYPQITKDGISLNVYFRPDKDYQIIIWGRKRITELQSIDDDINFDEFIHAMPYLSWQLANDLLLYNQMTPNPYIAIKIAKLKEKLKNMSHYDVSISKSRLGQNVYSPMQEYAYKAAEASLLGGWRP